MSGFGLDAEYLQKKAEWFDRRGAHFPPRGSAVSEPPDDKHLVLRVQPQETLGLKKVPLP